MLGGRCWGSRGGNALCSSMLGRRVIWMVAALSLIFAVCCNPASAQTVEWQLNDRKDFNEYMNQAVDFILDKANGRLRRGYEANGFYTGELDYGGKDNKAIKPSVHVPKTMCNASVAEVIIEALNKFYDRTSYDVPFKVVPAEQWYLKNPGVTDLRFHLFMLGINRSSKLYGKFYAADPPLPSLGKLEKLTSNLTSMADALELFGMGKRVEFAALRRGDIVTLNRSFCAGHSVVFLAYVDKNQDVVSTYPKDVEKAKSIVGFQYLSSQLGYETEDGITVEDGYDVRWGYFDRQFCPQVRGSRNPCDCKKRENCTCEDVRNSKFPPQKAGRPRDCCIIRTGPFGIKGGHVLHPALWTFLERKEMLKAQHDAVLAALVAELKARSEERMTFVVRNATQMEALFPSEISQLRSKFKDSFDRGRVDAVSAKAMEKMLSEQMRLVIRQSLDVELRSADGGIEPHGAVSELFGGRTGN